MLPLWIALAVTSTRADPDAELEEEIIEEVVEEDEEYEYEDEELDEQSERWYSERAFHLAIYGGARFMIGDELALLTGELGIGFSQRLSQRWALQGRAMIGGGFNDRGTESGLLEGEPVFESSADLTGRIGARRFYFGFGAFGRFWRTFSDAGRFAGGGGLVLELGWLIGEDRQLDIGVRANGGPFFETDRDLRFMLGFMLSVGWIF